MLRSIRNLRGRQPARKRKIGCDAGDRHSFLATFRLDQRTLSTILPLTSRRSSASRARRAIESIRRWWYQIGQVRFPDATRLLITADAGGSNGYRVRAWKFELAALAKETGLDITVCHYPPGTSKWNKSA